jgi:ferredoxin
VDVCLVVGEPFASFVLEHNASGARAITPEEAVEILEAEAQRGHVHHAFFKEAMLDRFYAICNCCSCCCGAIQAQRNGTPMLISSGYVSQLEETHCVSCGACVAACPFGAMTLNGRVAIDSFACMGCGVCVAACPEGALSLVRDESKPAPLEVPV